MVNLTHNKKIKLLIVGLGSIGKKHATNAAALDNVEAAVFDSAPGVAQQIGDDLDLTYFNEWSTALDWSPEAAVVAVPTHLHISVASELLKAGAHVLVEKPLSDRLSGVKDFLTLAQEKQRMVYVVCNMRFHPAIRAVYDSLHKVGKPLFARAHYGNYLPDMRPGADYRALYCARREMGGGVILDGIHEVDYLSWFFGDVDAVSCVSAKLSELDIDVEDYAHLSMRHTSGVRSEVHLDYLRRYKRRGLEIGGTEGSLIWLSEGKMPEHCSVRLHTTESGWETVFKDQSLDASHIYSELLKNFLTAINEGGNRKLLDSNTAYMELAATVAAHRSAQDGKLIRPQEMKQNII